MPRRRNPGRPTLLTPEVEDGILRAIRAGASLIVAAGTQGVGEDTVQGWMTRGEGRDPDRPAIEPYVAFARKVRLAQHETHARVVGTITRAALTSWEAARAWLRMRYPEQYAETLKMSVTLDVKAEAERIAAANGMDPEVIMAEAEAILASRE